ncbi:hypothetical protein BVI1335_1270007 [Burkholderia vietnamiensis]|nr:hypothetical protein BVI1335_1270007 [Burkholderia vietnamiensis]
MTRMRDGERSKVGKAAHMADAWRKLRIISGDACPGTTSLHDAMRREELRKFEGSGSFRSDRGRPEARVRVTQCVAANGGNRRRAPRIAAVYRSVRIIWLDWRAARGHAGVWRDAG